MSFKEKLLDCFFSCLFLNIFLFLLFLYLSFKEKISCLIFFFLSFLSFFFNFFVQVEFTAAVQNSPRLDPKDSRWRKIGDYVCVCREYVVRPLCRDSQSSASLQLSGRVKMWLFWQQPRKKMRLATSQLRSCRPWTNNTSCTYAFDEFPTNSDNLFARKLGQFCTTEVYFGKYNTSAKTAPIRSGVCSLN